MSVPADVGRPLTFVHLFEGVRNVHLMKDQGLVPYGMARYFGYDARIAGRDQDMPYRARFLPDLKFVAVGSSGYAYLWREARRIDVLMLHNICTRTIYRGLLYKHLNPRGLLYFKADFAGDRTPYITHRKNPLTAAKRRLLFSRLRKAVDIVSFETKATAEAVKDFDERAKIHVPNGFATEHARACGLERLPVERKENMILVVSRHGAPEKNSEILLHVAEELNFPADWRIVLVGPVTEKFRGLVDSLYSRRPDLRSRIVLRGELTEKAELFSLYSKAKICCLPSRHESWGLVCTEALAFGAVLVMSREIESAGELTGNGVCGRTAGCDDVEEWGAILSGLMADEKTLGFLAAAAVAHFDANFELRTTLAPLDARIREIIASRRMT